MVHVTLHVQHRYAAGCCYFADVLVAEVPITLANGNPIVVSAEDFADLFGCVAVGNLRRLTVNKLRMAAKLGHTRFKAGARPRTAEEKQHRQDFVAQQGVWFPDGAPTLQIPGEVEHGVEFVHRPFLFRDHVTTTQVGLHDDFLFSTSEYCSQWLQTILPVSIRDALVQIRAEIRAVYLTGCRRRRPGGVLSRVSWPVPDQSHTTGNRREALFLCGQFRHDSE